MRTERGCHCPNEIGGERDSEIRAVSIMIGDGEWIMQKELKPDSVFCLGLAAHPSDRKAAVRQAFLFANMKMYV